MYHGLIVSGTMVMLRNEKCLRFLNQYLALIQRTGFRSGGCCCFDDIQSFSTLHLTNLAITYDYVEIPFMVLIRTKIQHAPN